MSRSSQSSTTLDRRVATDGVPLATRPRKTAELLAQRIVANIIDSDHPPGTKLPPEKAMLEKYGVARGTLREALRFLEMQGVLRIKPGPGGGPWIDQIDSRPLASNLALLLAIDRTPFRAILEVRETLEPTLAARSAVRDDDENLLALRESAEALAANADDEKRVILENRRFHELIAVRAGNPVFARLVMALNWIIDGTPLGVHFPEAKVRASAQAHRRIYEAIAAKEEQRAYAEMERHLAEFTRFLEHRYGSTLDRPLRWDDVNNY